MDSKLRERFERLGPIRAVDRVSSGSPGVFVLRTPQGRGVIRTIDGMFALARRGMTTLRAKRAIEALVEAGRVFVELPTVENADALVADLARAGIAAAQIEPDKSIDVRQLRERLGLTRQQFALRYGLEVETVRNWEAGRREVDAAARSYLRAISNAPELVESAYAPTPDMRKLGT
jgi:putative transcriptional regulator